MELKKLVTPFRVGLLVIVSGIFLFMFLTFVRKSGLTKGEAISAYAYFDDAMGLGRKSRVQIAGIAVGEVSDVRLEAVADPKTGRERMKARVELRVRRDVGLKEDAAITKRSESILGDYLLDLYAGSAEAPPLPEGGEIKKVTDRQGMEAVFESLQKITADIEAVTSSLKNVLGGEKGEGSLEIGRAHV